MHQEYFLSLCKRNVNGTHFIFNITTYINCMTSSVYYYLLKHGQEANGKTINRINNFEKQ